MSHILHKKRSDLPDLSTASPDTMISILQSELDKAQKAALESQRELKHLNLQYEKLHEKEHETRKLAHYWRQKHDTKATELTEAKDALFDMQAPDQVPDSQIAQQWRNLCDAIEQWVDDYAHQDGDRHGYSWVQYCHSDFMGGAVGERVADWFDESRWRVNDDRIDRFNYVLRLWIHSILDKSVFDKNLAMPGIPFEDWALIEQIKDRLKTLNPPRDDANVALWRSEALKALVTTPEYHKYRQVIVEELVHEGKSFLSPLVVSNSAEVWSSFEHDIVDAAVNFDLILRQSTTNYYFVFEPQTTISSQSSHPPLPNQSDHLLFYSCFQKAAVIDLETGSRFTSKNFVGAEDQKPIAQKALVVYPALCCKRGTSELLLGKQLILAEMVGAETGAHR